MFTLMAAQQVDYTNWFRQLAQLTIKGEMPAKLLALLSEPATGFAWLTRYQQRLAEENIEHQAKVAQMNSVNPKYILRNHLAQQAIEKAEQGDMAEADRLLMVLARPFAEQPEYEAYAQSAPSWARDLTISCSS